MNAHCPGLDIEVVNETAVARGAAGWLSLAAAPTFAIMALLTAVIGSGSPDMLCSAMQEASPLAGMVPMYLLMSVFHSAPWLKLISGRHIRKAGLERREMRSDLVRHSG